MNTAVIRCSLVRGIALVISLASALALIGGSTEVEGREGIALVISLASASALALIGGADEASDSAGEALGSTLRVEQGQLVARGPGGARREGAALLGARVFIRDARGRRAQVRVDSVTRDARIPGSPLRYYGLSRRDPATGGWGAFCQPGPEGEALALAVDRRWWTDEGADAQTPELGFVCTAGARGKCIRIGYFPWARSERGESLRPYHEACVRMMRADYCGDETPHTRAGSRVAWIDRAGLFARWPSSALRFEAVWGPEGALCLGRVRHEDLASVDELRARCPRLAEVSPGECDERLLGTSATALLVNRS
jgi:hypothetical protein